MDAFWIFCRQVAGAFLQMDVDERTLYYYDHHVSGQKGKVVRIRVDIISENEVE